jgi:hypothetical protein
MPRRHGARAESSLSFTVKKPKGNAMKNNLQISAPPRSASAHIAACNAADAKERDRVNAIAIANADFTTEHDREKAATQIIELIERRRSGIEVAAQAAKVPDLYVQNDGSIFVAHPLTPAGKKFLQHECTSEGWQWLGEALAVDHHMIGAIVQVARDQGLTVE